MSLLRLGSHEEARYLLRRSHCTSLRKRKHRFHKRRNCASMLPHPPSVIRTRRTTADRLETVHENHRPRPSILQTAVAARCSVLCACKLGSHGNPGAGRHVDDNCRRSFCYMCLAVPHHVAKVRSATLIAAAMASSTGISLVSRITASAAASSGATARVLSRSSR
jgi:hypothetical protein